MTPVPDLEEAHAAAAPAMPGHTLSIGTRLRDYEIAGLIGEGAFGIVYLAWDHSLQRKVAIKEYLPAAIAARAGSTAVVVRLERQLDAFKLGLMGFVNEARLLAGFDHPSLLKVYRFWEENGTAYMVMPYHEGPTLKTALAELGHVPTEDELRAWLKPILNAVTVLHDGGTWHQNIGPDQIVLTPFGPVLLGMASAAHAIEATHHTPAAALKPGFAAIEQYGSEAGTTRGPWTDLYALAAVVYSAITGIEPFAAADRLAQDRLRPLKIVAAGLYSEGFLAAIDAAMAIQPKQRPADHAEFRALMGDIDAPEAVSLAPRRDLMQEPFVGLPPGDRQVTVPDRPLLAGAELAAASVAMAPVAPDARPRATTRPAPAAPARAKAARTRPAWLQASHVRNLGKRALYGVVAGTFALIGIAALVFQFATRPAPRVLPTTAPAASARPAPTVASRGMAPTSTPLTTATTATTATTPAASATPVAAPTASAAASLPARPAVVIAAPSPSPSPSPSPAAITPTAPTVPTVPTVPATPTAATPTASTDPRARCIDILQKASLEKITPAETDFFKRECK